jgi:hypothetical protein
MHTYRVQYLTEAVPGWTRDDLLASLVGGVSGATVVEAASVTGLGRGGRVLKTTVTFLGLNDAEARETVRRGASGLPAACDHLLDRRGEDGKYHRVPRPAAAR